MAGFFFPLVNFAFQSRIYTEINIEFSSCRHKMLEQQQKAITIEHCHAIHTPGGDLQTPSSLQKILFSIFGKVEGGSPPRVFLHIFLLPIEL